MTVNSQSAEMPSTLDADIAAFMAEEGLSPEANDTNEAEAGDSAEASDSPESDDDGSDAASDDSEVASENSAEAEETKPSAVDTEALAKAIEANDPVAFVKALGENADKLLTGKAHRALRLQVKAAEDTEKQMIAAQQKAEKVATDLHAKYGDPIAARKAAEQGDVNTFIDMLEKWGGTDFNTIQRWLINGIAGRPAKLEARKQEERASDLQTKAKQEQAKQEVVSWVTTNVQKLDATLAKEAPEIIELVVAEIQEGFGKGVDSPAKALPLAKKKLQAQYERLSKVFGKDAKGKSKGKAPSPSARATSAVGNNTRPLTLDEEIALFMKENGKGKGK